MKLRRARITNFKSIWDSTEFNIDEVTCLVGKNESGKTALLQALYKLNPVKNEHAGFDVRMEYPRQTVARYRRLVQSGDKEHDIAIRATFELERSDIEEVRMIFGKNCFTEDNPTITVSKGYSNELYIEDLCVDETAILKHLITNANLPVDSNKVLLNRKDVRSAYDLMQAWEMSGELHDRLKRMTETGISYQIYEEVLRQQVPKFLYFDEFYLMRGQDNLNGFVQRMRDGELEEHDYPLLGLIELAGLDPEHLLVADHTQTLTAEISAAENELTQMIMPYWTQNKNLRMKFDVREARSNDPQGMRTGTNIWGLVVDSRQNVELPIQSRSRGFVWFFSFLAWYSYIRREEENLILLLDEPGLSLHAKAQEDLLRYIDGELTPHHQVIYTTHSPFMVDPRNQWRVRIVQDMSMERRPGGQSKNLGTEVLSDIHAATRETLFPLQSAFGYELYQNLFIGPNCLVVEGVSDLMYIEAMSGILKEKDRESLSNDWIITPVGGVTNVPTFVALIKAQGNLNVALLVDNHVRDEQKIGNIYKQKLMAQEYILTYADFVCRREADVEDMFDSDFYLKLVNEEFGTSIKESDLSPGNLILVRINAHLKLNQLPSGAAFNHYRPARYFHSNVDSLQGCIGSAVLDRWESVFEHLNCLLKK